MVGSFNSGQSGYSGGGKAYTTKTLLAAWVDEQISVIVSPSGQQGYFVYFTLDFNAFYNPASSNPLEIYRELDEAIKKGDSDNTKVRTVREQLLKTAASYLARRNPAQYHYVIQQVYDASLERFAPQVWRIKLEEWSEDCYEVVPTGSDRREFRAKGYSVRKEQFDVAIP